MATIADSDDPKLITNQEAKHGTVLTVLIAISFSHLLNDTIQALIPSIYPILKNSYGLTFTQLGLITLAFQVTACLLQPLVGIVTDRRAMPYSLAIGMGVTMLGLVALAWSSSFAMVIGAVILVGGGSAIFHPEASRVAHMAAGKQKGLAQSLFQVGGNAGSAIGPLLAAWIIVPSGQKSLLLFCLLNLLGMIVLTRIGHWTRHHLERVRRTPQSTASTGHAAPRGRVTLAMTVLVILVFSKYVYLASLTSYYTFYLIDRFHISVQSSQMHLFLLLSAVAAGTVAGGPIGDRIGRKQVIWVSILGVAPFSMALPYASLAMTGVLSVIIGLVLASAFSAILVYAQELLPGKVGMVAGLFFGLAFGIGGIGSALLGKMADLHGINAVFHVCSYLPLLGILTALLPDTGNQSKPLLG